MPGLEGHLLLGRYRVEEYVGGGGMADVYRVWDQERSCYLAIKLMRQGLAELEEFSERFRREADVLSRLQHPNIVRFYGFEQDAAEGIAFILMDYVDGPTLATKLKVARQPLPASEVVAMTDDLASALNYAHNQGIYHRDIKPSNILIARDGRALLSDFGIARLSDALTMTYQGIGTPSYMSPEQCQGAELGPAGDIYSLGVVLYECLTGRRPFIGDFGRGESPTAANIIREHLELPPPAPTEINPSLRPEVEAVILKSLAKDSRYRYQSAKELASELRRAAGIAVLPDLKISTTPGGAQVFIDGALRGVSPLEVPRVPEGRHQIRIAAKGFCDHTQVIQVPDQRTLDIRLEAEAPPAPEATLAASSGSPGTAVRQAQPPGSSVGSPQSMAGRGRGGGPPPGGVDSTGQHGGWRRGVWFKAVLGVSGGVILAAAAAGLFVVWPHPGSGASPSPSLSPTLSPSPSPSGAATGTSTAGPTSSPSRSPAGTPKLTAFTSYANADPETGTIITSRPAPSVTAGEGALRFIPKYADGSIANTRIEVYSQGQDVNGEPVFGDDRASLQTQDDRSLLAALAPGTYAVKYNLVGYIGSWNFGYQVTAGQETDVTFIVSQLTIVVKDADGGLLKPYINVYQQGLDVNKNPIRGDSVASQSIPDEGKAVFDILPGKYWIEINGVEGRDWGQADNQVKPGTRTDISLTLGRIVYKSTQYECVSVRGEQTGASGGQVPTGQEYANKCVDSSYGGAVIDLVPGVYAIRVGSSVKYDVEVQASATTELTPKDFGVNATN